MKVKAKELGYYQNKRIYPGTVFTLVPIYKRDEAGKVLKDKNGMPIILVPPESQFSKIWMDKIVESQSTPSTPPTQPEKQQFSGTGNKQVI